METVDLNGVEIFSTGIWEGKGSAAGGDKITEEYLDSLVKTYGEIGDKVKPRMTLTHDGKKSEGIAGVASVGWIQNLRREGNKLVSDIKAVPKKIASLIDKKALGRFSPGIWNKMNVNGTIYENVIDHLALLGSDIPANLDLDGFIDLYENRINGEEIIQYKEMKDDTMDYEKIVKDLKEEITTFEKKEIDLKETHETEIVKLSDENKSLKEQISKVEFEKAENSVDSYLKDKVEKEIITPAQSVEYKKLMMGETAEDNGEVKEYGKKFDIVKNIIDSTPDEEDKKKSEHVVKPDAVVNESKTNYEKEGEELHEKITAYMKENDISDYAQAMKELPKEV